MLSLFARFNKPRNAIIEHLLKDPAPRVRHALLLNPHLPDTVRERLQDDEEAADFDPYFAIENPPEEWDGFWCGQYKQALAEDPDTPLEVLLRLTRDSDNYTAGLAVQNPSMPVEKLHEFARNPDLAIFVVSHPRCPERYLEKFSRHSDSSLRSMLAENPAAPAAVLERLAGSYENWVRAAVAKNPSAPAGLLLRLMQEDQECVRQGVAENPAAPAEALTRLADDPDFEVRAHVAGNPSTPLPVLMAMFNAHHVPEAVEDDDDGETMYMDDEDRYEEDHASRHAGIRWRVAANPAIPAGQLQWWSEDAGGRLQSAVATNPGTPPAVLLTIVQQLPDYESGTTRSLARHPAATAGVLSRLADNPDADTRCAVAGHANTPAAVLTRLAEDDDENVRQKVAVHAATPPEVLDALSRDENNRVRWLVAARADTPDGALKRLAEDAEEQIRENVARHIRPDA